ncbi:HAD-IIB family hydrolase [Propioniciclava sinopodophylli]|uniref:HAD-IIB family hydrolase n=1 Tax=Propioniciclava sinopodophylli TaxID=1837344 RepID=UPI002491E06B|nr:HAD family hydrolase [Propioniciclava sinopodophylli]
MSDVRLIATDLDGTLLDPSGRIAEAEAEAVRAASQAGIVVVVATGRPLRWLDVLAPIADADPLVVASNGAVVYDLHAGTVVRSHTLDVPLIGALAHDLRGALPGLLFALEEGRRFSTEDAWAYHLPDASRSLAQEESVTRRGAWASVLAEAGDVVKFLALHPDADPDDLLAAATDVLGGRAEVTHSVTAGRRALLEMSAPGISKAATIAELAAERGITPAQVAAFGDMPNDLAMLEYAGMPYVMANGHPALLERFAVIGSNAEGGVGAQIRRLLG